MCTSDLLWEVEEWSGRSVDGWRVGAVLVLGELGCGVCGGDGGVVCGEAGERRCLSRPSWRVDEIWVEDGEG